MGWLLAFSPFSWYEEGWTKRVHGISGTPAEWAARSPAQLPATTGSMCCRHPSLRLLGTPKKRLLPCPTMGLAGTLPQAAAGIVRFNSALSNFFGSFYWKLLTILCLAGTDDCSKPKLGINYTTTLHFSYKGKLCGKSCESTSFPWPPCKACGGRPLAPQMAWDLKTKQQEAAPVPVWDLLCHALARTPPPPLPNMREGCRMQEPSCNSKSTHLKEAPKAASADIWASISTMNGRSNSSLKTSPAGSCRVYCIPTAFLQY